MRLLLSLINFSVIMIFTSCSFAPRTNYMLPTYGELVFETNNKTIHVENISGGQKTGGSGIAKITSEQFAEVLNSAIRRSKIFKSFATKQQADYEISANIISQEKFQPLIIEYHIKINVIDHEFIRRFSSPYPFKLKLYGYRDALEMGIKNNVTKLIKELSKLEATEISYTDYKNAEQINTKQSYRDFINNHPNSYFAYDSKINIVKFNIKELITNTLKSKSVKTRSKAEVVNSLFPKKRFEILNYYLPIVEGDSNYVIKADDIQHDSLFANLFTPDFIIDTLQSITPIPLVPENVDNRHEFTLPQLIESLTGDTIYISSMTLPENVDSVMRVFSSFTDTIAEFYEHKSCDYEATLIHSHTITSLSRLLDECYVGRYAVNINRLDIWDGDRRYTEMIEKIENYEQTHIGSLLEIAWQTTNEEVSKKTIYSLASRVKWKSFRDRNKEFILSHLDQKNEFAYNLATEILVPVLVEN